MSSQSKPTTICLVIIAAFGEKRREVEKEFPQDFTLPDDLKKANIIMPGIIAITGPDYVNEEQTNRFVQKLNLWFKNFLPYFGQKFPLIILCDDSRFTSATLNNFLWITFTRSNPSHDIHGIDSFSEHKHWGCRGSLIIDARIKPHHAPPLLKEPEIEKRVDALGVKGGSLFGII